MTRPHRGRRLPTIALAAVLVVIAGCGSTPAPTQSPEESPSAASSSTVPSAASASPTVAPSVDNATTYARIEADVQAIRQLEARTPVEPHIVDQAGMTKLIEDELAATPADVVRATGASLRILGLLPAGTSLEELQRQMLTSQVAGLYNPEAKTLYVLSKQGTLGPAERVTFAHEFDHALQDQHFGLANLKIDEVGEGDRGLAHLALPEGDATLLMSLWAQQRLSAAETLQLFAEANDPQQTQTLLSLPAILRETLLFPYTTGLAFVTSLQSSGGWSAVDAAYARPPDSTEQLLHPEKYASHEAVLPIDVPVDLARRLGKGWTVPLVDSMGELQLRIWLREVGGLSNADATSAAAGWGGDRIAYATGPNGAWALALLTRWDSAADAAEFQRGASDAARSLQSSGESTDLRTATSDAVAVLFAPDQETWARLAAALGLQE
jgi:hypothetical protein